MRTLLKGELVFKKTPKDPTELDKALDELILEMKTVVPGSQQHTEIVKSVEVLYKAKSHIKDRRINPDTALVVGGNIAGILAVLTFEKFGIITSKAISMVLKTKI